MKKWEYKCVSIYPKENIIEELDMYGREGWEAFDLKQYAVEMFDLGAMVSTTAYFKRELK